MNPECHEQERKPGDRRDVRRFPYATQPKEKLVNFPSVTIYFSVLY